MVVKTKNKKINEQGLTFGNECDMGCKHAKDCFYGKIYCKKYGWILKNSQCRNYKPRN